MRSSPNGCPLGVVLMIVALLFPRALNAQDSTVSAPQFPGYRNPHTAETLGSFIPGAGHIYSGERLRGAGLMFVSLAGIAEGIASWTARCQVSFASGPDRCEPDPTAGSRLLSITQIAAGLGCWVISAVDAPRAAERQNMRLRAARVSISPAPRRPGGPTGVEARLTIHW